MLMVRRSFGTGWRSRSGTDIFENGEKYLKDVDLMETVKNIDSNTLFA